MSKKQQRKLVKQKAKELTDTVALMKKHKLKGTPLDEGTSGLKNMSLTKECQLPSHILVKDVITGMGPTVKLGQRVSILYEASFPTGRVRTKIATIH